MKMFHDFTLYSNRRQTHIRRWLCFSSVYIGLPRGRVELSSHFFVFPQQYHSSHSRFPDMFQFLSPSSYSNHKPFLRSLCHFRFMENHLAKENHLWVNHEADAALCRTSPWTFIVYLRIDFCRKILILVVFFAP